MINILKKIVATHHKDWITKLFNALWEDRISSRVSIGKSSYLLIYCKEYVLPSNLLLPSLHIAQYMSWDDESSPLQNRIDMFLKLEDEIDKSRNKLYQHQQLVKRWFDDKSSTNRDFQVGDPILKWDKPHKDKRDYTKFQRLWLGPFIITKKLSPGIVRLQTLEGFPETYPTNIQLLKRYFV